jgi:hypothetical protein
MKFGIQRAIAIGLLSLVSIGSVQAIPLYYSFEGTAGSLLFDQDFFDGIGLAEGDDISFTFMVDTGLQGTYTDSDGNTVEMQDSVRPLGQNGPGPLTDFILTDSFHVELVESTLFDLVQDAYPDRGNDEPWSGDGLSNSFYRNGMLVDGFAMNDTTLFGRSDSIGGVELSVEEDMSKWEVGTTSAGFNSTYLLGEQEGERHTVRSYDLLLTAVSTVNPASNRDISLVSGDTGNNGEGMPSQSVPEPSTFLLMGIGLLGIGARRYLKSA